MADVHSTEQRRRNMSAIRHRDTKPELFIRGELHKRGFRYRVHRKDLPGTPDIVLSKYNAIIFVHGCFWHGHNCYLFTWPKTRQEFWEKKITRNRELDKQAHYELLKNNWRVLTVWECALKGRNRLDPTCVIDRVAKWLVSDDLVLEISGLGKNAGGKVTEVK